MVVSGTRGEADLPAQPDRDCPYEPGDGDVLLAAHVFSSIHSPRRRTSPSPACRSHTSCPALAGSPHLSRGREILLSRRGTQSSSRSRMRFGHFSQPRRSRIWVDRRLGATRRTARQKEPATHRRAFLQAGGGDVLRRGPWILENTRPASRTSPLPASYRQLNGRLKRKERPSDTHAIRLGRNGRVKSSSWTLHIILGCFLSRAKEFLPLDRLAGSTCPGTFRLSAQSSISHSGNPGDLRVR